MCNLGEVDCHGCQRWKENQVHLYNLLTRIKTLEMSCKQSLAAQTLQELLHTRSLILEALDKISKRKFILTQKMFYEYGNKCGKHLERT